MRIVTMMLLVLSCAAYVAAQQPASPARAQELAAAFSKHKDVEKYGVRKYKDVRSEPAIKQNVSDYSGVYQVPDLGFVINIQVGTDGRVQANGSENSRTFKLTNAGIDHALLTGTKVYQDGSTEQFQGVFLKRTDRDSPTSAGLTMFGLGVMLTNPVELNGITYDKLFYRRGEN
jgi:hypothetical protein